MVIGLLKCIMSWHQSDAKKLLNQAGRLDAIILGSKKLPKLDPFADIDPLESDEIPDFSETEKLHEEYEHDEVEFFDESSGSEWEEDETRNAFDIFENDDWKDKAFMLSFMFFC